MNTLRTLPITGQAVRSSTCGILRCGVWLSTLALIGLTAYAGSPGRVELPHLVMSQSRRHIRIPDILGFQTLKCDFHMHTVFSDGSVWPTIRVDEAWQEGLDAIAITDHIERNPSKKHVGGDDNAAYTIAEPHAREMGIILIRGAEITRAMPPGHLNALFVQDAQKLDVPDVMDALQEAGRQGAFIFWNHPGWADQQPEAPIMFDIHRQMATNRLLCGIEVFNEKEWYPAALDWCHEHRVAVLSNSDIHDLVSHTYDLERGRRPMTLVLSTERTERGIRDALFAGRTIACFDDRLAGRAEYLSAIFEASVKTRKIAEVKNRKNEKEYVWEIVNSCEIPFVIASVHGTWSVPGNRTIIHRGMPGVEPVPVRVLNLHVSGEGTLNTEMVFHEE